MRIARRRPEGGAATNSTSLDAPDVEAAITRVADLVELFSGNQPDVASLTNAYPGLIWSHHHNMPEPELRET